MDTNSALLLAGWVSYFYEAQLIQALPNPSWKDQFLFEIYRRYHTANELGGYVHMIYSPDLDIWDTK